MSTNGFNYSMYNTAAYSQMAQQQQPSYYGQRFPTPLTQSSLRSYGTNSMYPSSSLPNQLPYNSYDHIIRSAAETLAAFTHPSEISTRTNAQSHLRSLSNSQATTNRRSTNNPSNTNNSVRMYYCETCRIACGGHATYQAHLNGSRHKKKEVLTQTQQPSVNLSSKIGVHILRCELCDITCTSSDAYKAHLDGSKHGKAMKLHRKLGKTIPSIEPQIINNISSLSQSNVISATSIHGYQTDDQQISLSRLLENSTKPIGEEYIETMFDNTNKPVLYHCKLCECKFNDIKGKDMHLKGKRHRLSYKKKVNPDFIVENNSNNKFPSPKQTQINTNQWDIEYLNAQQTMNNNNNNNNNSLSEIDQDTKCLMTLHEQIIPTPNLLTIVDEFVSTVESALKSCSAQLTTSSSDHGSSSSTSETTIHPSPLLGVSLVGLLGKSLLIKTDRLFHIVIVCTEWPSKGLFQTITATLPDHFNDAWKNRIQVQYDMQKETIELQTDTEYGRMYISIAFTSPSIQEEEKLEDDSDKLLSKRTCLNASYLLHSTRWFQNQVSIRQHASALIRCLRYKTKTSTYWQSLTSEALEILIDHTLLPSVSPVKVFRRVLECLSSGLVLYDGPDLYIPWRRESMTNVFENYTNQQRNDITQEAQTGLRLMSFGQLAKWFQQSILHQSPVCSSKHSYSDNDEDLVATKRQCKVSE